MTVIDWEKKKENVHFALIFAAAYKLQLKYWTIKSLVCVRYTPPDQIIEFTCSSHFHNHKFIKSSNQVYTGSTNTF